MELLEPAEGRSTLPFHSKKDGLPARRAPLSCDGDIAKTFMLRKSLGVTLVCVLALSGGCVTAPAANAPASYTSALGDRSAATLDEVVVSLPFRGTSVPYHNLHVALAVFANPMRETSGSPYEVESLVRRLDARIGSQLSALLAQAGPQSIDSMPALRDSIAKEAEKVLTRALQGWKYAADYKVEVVVHSLYWTDASVGKSPRSGRGGF